MIAIVLAQHHHHLLLFLLPSPLVIATYFFVRLINNWWPLFFTLTAALELSSLNFFIHLWTERSTGLPLFASSPATSCVESYRLLTCTCTGEGKSSSCLIQPQTHPWGESVLPLLIWGLIGSSIQTAVGCREASGQGLVALLHSGRSDLWPRYLGHTMHGCCWYQCSSANDL